VEAAFRIERVEERKEIVLVGAAAVQQNERADRVARCGALKRAQHNVRRLDGAR